MMYCVFSLRQNKSYSICKRSRDCSDCFVVIISVVIFPMPSKVIIIVIEIMFLDINTFRALLRAH